MDERHDVLVIGGGQAGLAMSAVLRDLGREHIVLERARVGERWRSERWDSLRFQFPNWAMALPGWQYAGDDPDGFAPAAEVARLIEEYGRVAPVRERTEVVSLTRDDDGFLAATSEGRLRAASVVVATGPFQQPKVPEIPLPASITITEPTHHRNPEALPDGAVLVVGAGASGIQIAEELADAGRRVFLAVSPHRRVPRRYRGRDVYWWLDRMGRFEQTIDSFPGRRWPPHTAVTGVNGGHDIDLRRLAAAGATLVGRVRGASGTRLLLEPRVNAVLDDADAAYRMFVQAARELAATLDEELAEDDAVEPGGPTLAEPEELDLEREGISTVIWATGYSYDYPWLHVDVLDELGRPVQQRGVTAVPGLFFLGLHWMHTFKSGLLSGVGADARFISEHLPSTISR